MPDQLAWSKAFSRPEELQGHLPSPSLIIL